MTPVEFLRRIHPRAPWALAAIHPDLPSGHPDKIKCLSVDDRNEAAAARFVKIHNRRRNVYYQINVVCDELRDRRAKKHHIVACVGLHCEIDPPDGVEDLAAWQRERRRWIDEWPPNAIPRPTLVVFSGSGFQLIWLLDERTEHFAAVESRNHKLVELLGGDPGTWGVDRLLRLPGTLNHPGKKKRRQYGRRGPVRAEVLS